METQTKLILEYMRKNGSITPMEALRWCDGCFRLAARISNLKDAGHKITTVMTSENGKRYARYFLND